jgi:tetratricopeptide (TPR) repeat protein
MTTIRDIDAAGTEPDADVIILGDKRDPSDDAAGGSPADFAAPLKAIRAPVEDVEIVPIPVPSTHITVRAGLHAMALSIGLALGWAGAQAMGPVGTLWPLPTEERTSLEAHVRQDKTTLQLKEAEAGRHAAEEAIIALTEELDRERQAHAQSRAQADEALAALAKTAAEQEKTESPSPETTLQLASDEAPSAPEPVSVPQKAPVTKQSQGETGLDFLEKGRAHFKKGELADAREAFAKAVQLGLAEGALGLGTTYDPKSLAKAGFNESGEAEQARHWYRRAYQLAGKPVTE